MKLRRKQILAFVLALATFLSTLSFPTTAYAEGQNDLQIVGSHFYEYAVKKGGSVTLRAEVSAPDMSKVTYGWFKTTLINYYSGGFEGLGFAEEIPNAQENELVLENITEPCDYYCVVDNGYQEAINILYHVSLDNNFEVRILGDDGFDPDNIMVSAGDDFTMEVKASGTDLENVTYEWYVAKRPEGELFVDEDFEQISDAYTDSFTARDITDNCIYECRVRDGYGNNKKLTFYVNIDNHLAIVNPNETVAV